MVALIAIRDRGRHFPDVEPKKKITTVQQKSLKAAGREAPKIDPQAIREGNEINKGLLHSCAVFLSPVPTDSSARAWRCEHPSCRGQEVGDALQEWGWRPCGSCVPCTWGECREQKESGPRWHKAALGETS